MEASNSSKELIHKGKFISYYNFCSGSGCTGVKEEHEFIVRNSPHSSIHGAKVIPIARSKHMEDPQLILIVGYRVPIQKPLLEFPSGLCDDKEDISECCLRELREETGYIGKIVKSDIKLCFNDPWKSDDNEVVYFAEVDLDSEENKRPEQKLDTDENIKVVLIKAKELCKELAKYAKEHVCAIDTSLWAFAIGYDLASLPH